MVGVAGYIYQIYYSPIMSSAPDGNSVILIPRGSTFDSVTVRIRKKGLLPYPRLYDYLAEKLKVHSRIQAGEFKIQHNWNTSELLQYLISGKSIRHRITIPEGENYLQIAERLQLAEIADKEIPGFGELFRELSYKTIGTSAMQSRACAVLANGKYIFALPGSSGGVTDAWDGILKYQLDINHKPCNFVELFPRLKEK